MKITGYRKLEQRGGKTLLGIAHASATGTYIYSEQTYRQVVLPLYYRGPEGWLIIIYYRISRSHNKQVKADHVSRVVVTPDVFIALI